MDRVKESLFNILGQGIRSSTFLDLFAGTGSVGIEALSRGAARVVFIDTDRMAIRTIHENLALTQLAEHAEVLRTDAFAYLTRRKPAAFEYIYIAPPQYKGLWKEALEAIDANPAANLEPDGVVVVQIDPSERVELELQALQAYDERVYGNTLLWFFEYPLTDLPDDQADGEDAE
jgi:16S rRNA (guanine(966)-N(2))-methyltransferase RsmD